jgi:hypothetical protein
MGTAPLTVLEDYIILYINILLSEENYYFQLHVPLNYHADMKNHLKTGFVGGAPTLIFSPPDF